MTEQGKNTEIWVLADCGGKAPGRLLNALKSVHLSPRICIFAGTTCSTPTSIEHANIRVKSYNENSRERYICNSGFKRKAGTSSLTKCLRKFHAQDRKCPVVVLSLGDRSLTPQRPPSKVAPARVTPEPDSPSPSGKGARSYSFTDVTVAVPILVVVLFGATIVVIRVVRCRQSRQTSWTPSVEMENIEDMPMTGGTDGRDDTENRHAV
ncbi:interleukin-15 receptor subunit alpha [Pteropus vampyrus]|uniref:Interleukin-15 receptor subunit alpha n=1 Tax=Pteropus vampyrus TaxID=132908 RepID=A0A6P6C0N5_PTEVA|nr:interleukin-15 receptor subunit alpha [Pteropus vampyrus]